MRSVTHVSAVTCERHRRERSTAAMAAWLHWLARSSGERRRQHQRRAPFDPRWPTGGRHWLAVGGSAAAAGGPATAGSPAGPRRLVVPGSPARPSGVSELEPAATATRTVEPPCRRDHRDRHDRRYRCAAGRSRHERATCTARAAALSVRRRRTVTNQATVAAHAKEARRELLQTARGRNNQNY